MPKFIVNALLADKFMNELKKRLTEVFLDNQKEPPSVLLEKVLEEIELYEACLFSSIYKNEMVKVDEEKGKE